LLGGLIEDYRQRCEAVFEDFQNRVVGCVQSTTVELPEIIIPTNEKIQPLHKKPGISPRSTGPTKGQCASSQQASKLTTPPAGAAPSESRESLLNESQRRILTVLVQRRQMGQATTPRSMLATMVGLKSTSGTYGTYLSRLRTAGYIQGSGEITITPDGQIALGPVKALPTGEELIQWYVDNKLNNTQALILRNIRHRHPHGISRNNLAESAGLAAKSGTYGTYLSRMRNLGIIAGSSTLKLTDAVAEGL